MDRALPGRSRSSARFGHQSDSKSCEAEAQTLRARGRSFDGGHGLAGPKLCFAASNDALRALRSPTSTTPPTNPTTACAVEFPIAGIHPSGCGCERACLTGCQFIERGSRRCCRRLRTQEAPLTRKGVHLHYRDRYAALDLIITYLLACPLPTFVGT